MASYVNSSVESSGLGTMKNRPSATSAHSGQVLEQPIELLQSLELVQITVCAVVSTVAHLRGLFPDDCFRTHRYDIEDPNYCYKDFMEATDSSLTKAGSSRKKVDHNSVPWEIIMRGKNVGANKLLDWMELGVADALSHMYLASMQLTVYDGEVSLTKRLEAYIMVFSYSEAGAEMTLQLSGGNGLPSPSGKSIRSAKQDLRFLVHRLSNHIGGFPGLSPQSIVNMHLTYNEACPPSYEPPGFVMCQDHTPVLQSNEGAPVGSINPGPHSVNLRVFLNESNSNPTTSMATLRGRGGTLCRTDSPIPTQMEIEIMMERSPDSDPVLATLNPVQELDQPHSPLSTTTTALNTQERGQLAAIESMARLRFAQHDPRDTQMLDTIASVHSRHGSVDLDGESTAHDGSSTQGTPSTVGGRRSARLALRSTAGSPPKALSMLRPRKQQPSPHVDQILARLRKVSEARSPFKRKYSKK